MTILEEELVGSYTPESTHQLLYDAADFPDTLFDASEAVRRLQSFEAAGYVAVAGVLVIQEMPVQQAVTLHEKGNKLIEAGCLLGPYLVDGEVVRGFRFFVKEP